MGKYQLSKYQSIIGLEIHAELDTNSKMFCSCKNDPSRLRLAEADPFIKKPNIYICPVCLGLPGSLPVLNQKAVAETIKLGLALNCKINPQTKWDRKNYFYPDLPKGYQISQYDLPLCHDGYLEFSIFNFQFSNKFQNPIFPAVAGPRLSGGKKIRVRRVHLEEDTGKLIHPAGKNYSLIDFNRAGVPLLEMVTEPDITSAAEAKEFSQEIQKILRTLKISNADMEKGEMRVEVNISLKSQKSKVKSQKLGTKVEIKNLNSFRSVERAINFEIKRQTEILEKGGKVSHETRGFDEKSQKTYSQRSKETAPDYRYFPEPDLLPLQLGEELEGLIKELPLLPDAKRQSLVSKHHLAPKQAEILVAQNLFEQFETVVKLGGEAKAVANLLINQPQNRKLKPAALLRLIKEREGEKEEVSVATISQILAKNQKAILDYQKGKENALQFLVGEVMRETKGKIDAQEVRKQLLKKLKTL